MELIRVKQLVHKVNSEYPWFSVTHNCNIYRGCDHGCIYCDSRSSCYQIPHFDEIKVKEDSDIKIENELKTKRKKGVLGLGGMNDPYNRYEKQFEYTRSALKSCNKYGFGVVIITKSTLVLRDIDILKEIREHSKVIVLFTITTAEDRLQSRIERNVSSSSERFKAIKELSKEGIYTGVMMSPLLPFINDTVKNVTEIVTKASENNAAFIYPGYGVTLRGNQRQYFFQKIGEELTAKYVDTFGDSYMCTSPNSKKLETEFTKLCKKHMIYYKMNDIIEHANDYKKRTQLTLF